MKTSRAQRPNRRIQVQIFLTLIVALVATACGVGDEAGEVADSNDVADQEEATADSNDVADQEEAAAESSDEVSETDDAFPSRPITLIVPFSVGGGTDQFARAIASIWPDYSDVSLRIQNLPGAGGTDGIRESLTADPDGYTLSFGSGSTHLVAPLLADLGFDIDDFEPVASVSDAPMVIITREDSPWQSIEDLVDYMRDNPNEVTYATSGPQGSGHIAGEMLSNELGFEWVHVPFDGVSDAAAQVMGGHVDVGIVTPGVIDQTMNLATTSSQTLPDYPEIPTMIDSGYDFEYVTWRALFVPAGTPDDRVEYLADVFDRLGASDEYGVLAEGIDAVPPTVLTGDELQDRILAEEERFMAIIDTLRE